MPNQNSHAKHVPERTCVVCRAKREAGELLSFFVLPQGIVFDPRRQVQRRKHYVCSGPDCLRGRDASGDGVKLFHSGLFARQVRNGDGLQAILADYFGVAARVESFVGHWMRLPEAERTRLGSGSMGARLGFGVVLGARVWDRQHQFRIRLGPMGLADYEAFLPGGQSLPRLLALVRQYLCFELDWDVRLVLRRPEVPALRLGGGQRLGWTSWLGRPRGEDDPAPLALHAEDALARRARKVN